MANHYEEATVAPFIPGDMVTELEKTLLRGFGFEYESSDSNGVEELYFYADTSTSEEFNDDLPPLTLAGEQDDAELVASLKRYYQSRGIDPTQGQVEGDSFHDELPVNWTSLFQGISRRMQGDDPKPVPISVEAAFYCDKMRPGEFGGWVSVITADQVKSGSTKSLLSSFLREFE